MWAQVVQNGLVMKTTARPCALFALSIAASIACVAIGCSSPPESSSLDGNDEPTTPSKKKATEADDKEGVTNNKKSDTTAPPVPTPPPAPTPTPTTTATTPPPPPPPKVDPNSCANLGACCNKISNTYGQLACLAVQLRGDADTCAKSLIGCLATVGLGGGSGGTRCNNSSQCPGAQICNAQGVCQ